MNIFPLEGVTLVASIIFAVTLLALAGWVAFRYKSVGVFGLLAFALLPASHLGWWYTRVDTWTIWVSAAVVAGLIAAGMLVSKEIDDLFHVAAIASSFLLPLVLALIAFTVNLPVPVGVLGVTLAVGAFLLWRAWRRRKADKVAAPAVTS